MAAPEEPRGDGNCLGWFQLPLLLLYALALSFLTVYFQAQFLHLDYIETGTQVARHDAVLRGTSFDPWQYRILSELIAQGFLRAARAIHAPHPVLAGFLGFRILQNWLIFLLVACYFRLLGFSQRIIFLGLTILAWSMLNMFVHSDLQFSTYSDAIFQLLAAIAILQRRYLWILPIILVAAFNRETSGIILVLLVAGGLALERETSPRRQVFFIAAAGFLLYAAAIFLLRRHYGPRPYFLPPDAGYGKGVFLFNITNWRVWLQLFATTLILPLFAVVEWRRLPRILQSFLYIYAPIWIVIHFMVSSVIETRFLLAPMALAIIPASLKFLSNHEITPK